MKTKHFLFLGVILSLLMSSLSSCNPDNLPDGISEGWYIDRSSLPTSSSFTAINNSVNKKEVLSTYGTTKYVASYDLFIQSDGSWKDNEGRYGKYKNSITSLINVWRIKDNETIELYVATLYKEFSSGTKGKTKLYSFYSGSVFGTLGFYGTPTTYTYVTKGNKIIVSNGTTFIASNGALTLDGSSRTFTRYTPN